jgi:hypothetical protein
MDAVTRAVEAVTNAEKEEKKNQPESVSNESVPSLAAPAGGQNYKLLVTDPTHRRKVYRTRRLHFFPLLRGKWMP